MRGRRHGRAWKMRLSSWMRGGTGRSLIRVRPLPHVVLCRAMLEHLHRDWARWSRICTGTGLTPSQWLCAFGTRGSASAARGCRCSARRQRRDVCRVACHAARLHAEFLQGGKIVRFITDTRTNTCAAAGHRCIASVSRTLKGCMALARQVRAGLHGGPSCDRRISRCRRSQQRRRCPDVASRFEITGNKDGR